MTFTRHSRRALVFGAATTAAAVAGTTGSAHSQTPVSALGGQHSTATFSTLADAQRAAVSGLLTTGTIVMILGYDRAGDGGALYAEVIAEGRSGVHPHADRLRILGAL